MSDVQQKWLCQVSDVQKNNTVMALSWLLLSVRCTKHGFCSMSIYNTVWLCHGFAHGTKQQYPTLFCCSVSDVQKNNIQHCDGFVMASAQCQMYKKTTYNTVMALSWLLLSVRCTTKNGFVVVSAQCQYATL